MPCNHILFCFPWISSVICNVFTDNLTSPFFLFFLVSAVNCKEYSSVCSALAFQREYSTNPNKEAQLMFFFFFFFQYSSYVRCKKNSAISLADVSALMASVLCVRFSFVNGFVPLSQLGANY